MLEAWWRLAAHPSPPFTLPPRGCSVPLHGRRRIRGPEHADFKERLGHDAAASARGGRPLRDTHGECSTLRSRRRFFRRSPREDGDCPRDYETVMKRTLRRFDKWRALPASPGSGEIVREWAMLCGARKGAGLPWSRCEMERFAPQG